MSVVSAASGPVVVSVELFGTARMKAGARCVPVEVEAGTPIADLLRSLSEQCPELIGCALSETGDRTITVADGYALNRNGLAFLPPDGDAPLDWHTGDSLLLLSNQAGG